MGMESDPRGKARVAKYLSKAKKAYEELKEDEKQYFDLEKIENPYSDSRIHAGLDTAKVKRILVGIDIGSAELLLASQLNERNKNIDLAIAHHPIGKSLADLHDVMDMAVDFYEDFGVPTHVAEDIMDERAREVGRSVHAANHYATIDMARILGINLLNLHTVTDNLVQKFLTDFFKKKKPETIGEAIKCLLEIPEYQEGKKRGFGPKIFAGAPNRRLGKYVIEMTGGTNPSNKVYQELSAAGVSTVIGMHMRDDATDKAKERHMNVLIAGHISSDSLGMNLFLDELEKKGIEIVPCGGLIRVNRNNKKKN